MLPTKNKKENEDPILIPDFSALLVTVNQPVRRLPLVK